MTARSIYLSDDRYKVNEKQIIGKGSYSVVYSGYDTKDEKNVAIKKISVGKMDNITKQMIDREVEVINKLKERPHKNIVRFYDIVKTVSIIWIVMELCDQGCLSNILVKPMKDCFIKYYFKQIIEGILFINSLGLIHRDIKPENILLTDDYRTIKLTDFGFSEQIDYISQQNICCGSPIYMAPEMILNRQYDEKIDLWASGIILYQMFYGYHPFKGLKDLDTLNVFMSQSNKPIRLYYSDHTEVDIDAIELMERILTDRESRITANEILESEWMMIGNNIPQNISLRNLFYNKINSSIFFPHSLPSESMLQKTIEHDTKNKSKSQIFDKTIQTNNIDRVLFTGQFRKVINNWNSPIDFIDHDNKNINDKYEQLLFPFD